jgi:cell division protein FtsL
LKDQLERSKDLDYKVDEQQRRLEDLDKEIAGLRQKEEQLKTIQAQNYLL